VRGGLGMTSEKVVLTIEEVAKQLHTSRTTIFKLIKEGLPTIRVGKRRLVPIKSFGEWLEKNTVRRGKE